jgi:hypothetical protein
MAECTCPPGVDLQLGCPVHDEAAIENARRAKLVAESAWTDRFLGDGRPLTPEDAAALIIKMVEQTGARRLPDDHRRYIHDVCKALREGSEPR